MFNIVIYNTNFYIFIVTFFNKCASQIQYERQVGSGRGEGVPETIHNTSIAISLKKSAV